MMPEHQLPEDAHRGLVSLGPVEELLYAALLHPTLEAYGLQNPSYDGLQDLCHDVADDEYDDSAYQLWQERQERAERVL
jgi:hypothetical protein